MKNQNDAAKDPCADGCPRGCVHDRTLKTFPGHTPGLGTKLAEDINTAIDNNGYWDGDEMGGHLRAIQPDRKTQKLWDAAPDLLRTLTNMVSAFNVKEIDPLAAFATIEQAKGAIAKAEGK